MPIAPSSCSERIKSHALPVGAPRWVQTGVLCGVLLLVRPTAKAESSLAYKYEDYQESGRIKIETHGTQLEQDLTPDIKLKIGAVVDTVTGATPDGERAPAGSTDVPLTEMTDKRTAWNVELARQFSRTNVSLGYSHSLESDYLSNGWSLNTLTDFNEKNTTLLLGIAGANDRVKVFYQDERASKRTLDFIVGVTQLLDPDTTFTLNYTRGSADGYLADPYKLVQKSTEVLSGLYLDLTFPENRPSERTKNILLASCTHNFADLGGALESSYRFYNDSFGTNAHTLELAWFQRLSEHFVLSPSVRYYRQSAADFYYYNLDATSIVPIDGAPSASGPFYSSDYRLSQLDSYTYGIKAVWSPTSRLSLDIAYDRYVMHGRDDVTPASAYPKANVFTVGAKFSW